MAPKAGTHPDKYNGDECAIMRRLANNGPTTLKDLTTALWPDNHGKDPTSRTRNALRKPILDGWVYRLDDGRKGPAPELIECLAGRYIPQPAAERPAPAEKAPRVPKAAKPKVEAVKPAQATAEALDAMFGDRPGTMVTYPAGSKPTWADAGRMPGTIIAGPVVTEIAAELGVDMAKVPERWVSREDAELVGLVSPAPRDPDVCQHALGSCELCIPSHEADDDPNAEGMGYWDDAEHNADAQLRGDLTDTIPAGQVTEEECAPITAIGVPANWPTTDGRVTVMDGVASPYGEIDYSKVTKPEPWVKTTHKPGSYEDVVANRVTLRRVMEEVVKQAGQPLNKVDEEEARGIVGLALASLSDSIAAKYTEMSRGKLIRIKRRPNKTVKLLADRAMVAGGLAERVWEVTDA